MAALPWELFMRELAPCLDVDDVARLASTCRRLWSGWERHVVTITTPRFFGHPKRLSRRLITARLVCCPNVQTLWIPERACVLSDDLCGMSRLRALSISQMSRGVGAGNVSMLTSLTHLALGKCTHNAISDAAIQPLSMLTHLVLTQYQQTNTMAIFATRDAPSFTDACVSALAHLTHLSLDGSVGITGNGLARLAPTLRALELGEDLKITMFALESMTRLVALRLVNFRAWGAIMLTRLKVLDVFTHKSGIGKRFSDDDAVHLGRLEHLRALPLDVNLASLKCMTRLRRLAVARDVFMHPRFRRFQDETSDVSMTPLYPSLYDGGLASHFFSLQSLRELTSLEATGVDVYADD